MCYSQETVGCWEGGNVENYMDVGFFETHFGTRNRKVKPSVQTVPPLRMKGKKVRLVPADARTQQPDLH